MAGLTVIKERLTRACVYQDIYGLCGSPTTQRGRRALSVLTLVWKQENGRPRSVWHSHWEQVVLHPVGGDGGDGWHEELFSPRFPRPQLCCYSRAEGRMGEKGGRGCQGGRGPGPRTLTPPAPLSTPSLPRAPLNTLSLCQVQVQEGGVGPHAGEGG